eukprot:753069-Hanusia_phi.AAC.2
MEVEGGGKWCLEVEREEQEQEQEQDGERRRTMKFVSLVLVEFASCFQGALRGVEGFGGNCRPVVELDEETCLFR